MSAFDTIVYFQFLCANGSRKYENRFVEIFAYTRKREMLTIRFLEPFKWLIPNKVIHLSHWKLNFQYFQKHKLHLKILQEKCLAFSSQGTTFFPLLSIKCYNKNYPLHFLSVIYRSFEDVLEDYYISKCHFNVYLKTIARFFGFGYAVLICSFCIQVAFYLV